MKKISSKMTFFHKYLFPALWFGFLAVFLVIAVAGGAGLRDPMFLIGPIVMAVFGFFMMKKLVWVLADEVYDYGDYLLVKNGGSEERVDFSNIMNVSTTTLMNPPQITLRLITPGKIGDEITFSPATGFTLNPFAKSKVAENLMIRAHQARERGAI
jgi:hypothetical protein